MLKIIFLLKCMNFEGYFQGHDIYRKKSCQGSLSFLLVKKAKTSQINTFTLTIKYPKLRLSCLMLNHFLLIQLSFSYININDVKNKVWEHSYTKHFASFMRKWLSEVSV